MLAAISRRFEANTQKVLASELINSMGKTVGGYFERYLRSTPDPSDLSRLSDPTGGIEYELVYLLQQEGLPFSGVEKEGVFFQNALKANEYVRLLIRCLVNLRVSIASLDADLLYYCVGAIGVDERTLVDVICPRTKEQLDAINDVYRSRYGRTLEEYITRSVGGNLQQFLQYTRMNPNVFDAKLLYDALTSFSASKKIVIEILCTRDSERLKASVNQYRFI
jgi:hypothetical protein